MTLQHVRRWTSRVERLPQPTRYAVAVAAAAAGLVIRLIFDPVWGAQLPYITLFPAIMVSGWVGGFGPGLLATLLCAVGAGYYWVPPLESLWITDPREWLSLSVFVFNGAIISALNETWRRANVALAASEERLAEALATNSRMLAREQEARVEIEHAGRLKDDFLAVLSHELRTPLNAVLGYAQLLMTGAVPPDRTAHALQAIQRNAQAQLRLVESLLDLSRVLAGKLDLNAEVTQLPAVVALAVDAVSPEAQKKSISLRVTGSNSVAVFADGARLQQVFWNLLSNAIKFTPPHGHVTVDLSTNNNDAVIRVSDDGRGITPALLPFVFDRFKQGDGETSRSRTGLGLGLALVRELVHAHQGTVRAESAGEGLGSTFTVRLPLLLPGESAASVIVEPTGQPAFDLHQSRPDVLIVDDERDAREMLALALETRCASVRHVGTAPAAFEAMVQQRPDILLADVGMPEEDGHSLIRRWRDYEEGSNGRVAAIAVTAYASLTDRETALAAGFDGHVSKPVDTEDLVRLIAAVQARQRGSIR